MNRSNFLKIGILSVACSLGPLALRAASPEPLSTPAKDLRSDTWTATDALGRALHVMISFKFNSGQKYDKKPNDILIPILRSSSDVIHFWEIYGELDFLIEAAFSSKERMHRFLDNLRSYGFVRSHLIAMSMKGAVQEA